MTFITLTDAVGGKPIHLRVDAIKVVRSLNRDDLYHIPFSDHMYHNSKVVLALGNELARYFVREREKEIMKKIKERS